MRSVARAPARRARRRRPRVAAAARSGEVLDMRIAGTAAGSPACANPRAGRMDGNTLTRSPALGRARCRAARVAYALRLRLKPRPARPRPRSAREPAFGPPGLPGKACRRQARARPGARSANRPGSEGGLKFRSAGARALRGVTGRATHCRRGALLSSAARKGGRSKGTWTPATCRADSGWGNGW
jgi:hypothetical protein